MNILKETFVVLSNIINYVRPHIASAMSVYVTLFLKKVFFFFLSGCIYIHCDCTIIERQKSIDSYGL